MDVLAPRAGNYRGKRQVAGAYPKAFSMNSMPKNASTERTATSISTNTMLKAIIRSLAASLLMSHGMLGNVNEPERMGQTSASRSRRENLYFFAETILF